VTFCIKKNVGRKDLFGQMSEVGGIVAIGIAWMHLKKGYTCKHISFKLILREVKTTLSLSTPLEVGIFGMSLIYFSCCRDLQYDNGHRLQAAQQAVSTVSY